VALIGEQVMMKLRIIGEAKNLSHRFGFTNDTEFFVELELAYRDKILE